MNYQLPINPENQAKMAAYMLNQFEFCGVKAPQRHEIERQWWQNLKQLDKPALLAQLKQLYEQPQREYQIITIDLIYRARKIWRAEDLLIFLSWAQTKIWWDSIDTWRKLFSYYGQLSVANFQWTQQLFQAHDNFWMRRIGITLQLGYRDKTDTKYLRQMILADSQTSEFFIQKAIGWALRDYSKTNPTWVREFIENQPLSYLAKKEASRYI